MNPSLHVAPSNRLRQALARYIIPSPFPFRMDPLPFSRVSMGVRGGREDTEGGGGWRAVPLL